MRTVTLLLLVGVVLGAVYMVSADEDAINELDKMFEDSMNDGKEEDKSSVSTADSGSDKKGGDEGGKKGGGKKGGGKKWGGKKGRGLKDVMKKLCDKFEKKKSKFAEMKGKGGAKMIDKMDSKCAEVKKGADTAEGDKDFFKKNFMDRLKGKGSKGKGGGKGGGGKWDKLREKFEKFSAGKE